MMKYICVVDDYGNQLIFTFPKNIDHDVMADSLFGLKNQTIGNWERIWREPISAGFVTQTGECFGKSETLNLESRAKDTELLAEQFKG